jgi:hypothetical protein
MTDEGGTTYEMGEAGTEYLIPEKHLAPLLGRGARGLTPAYAGAGGLIININSPLIQTSGLSSSDLEAAGTTLWSVIEREARRRGRN